MSDHVKAYIICAITILIFASFFFLNHTANQESDKYDHATFCKKGEPEEITVILIDHSDQIGPVQKEALERRLWDIATSIPKHSVIKVFSVDQVNQKILAPEIDLCNPGTEDSVNELTGNKVMARKRYEEKFRKPLSEILNKVLVSNGSPKSPIMSSVQSVSVSSFIGRNFENSRKNIVLVSDLLEHTSDFSLYSAKIPTFQSFQESNHWRAVRSDLSNVNVTILFLRRANSDKIQTTDLRQLWIDFFEKQGAVIERFVPIEG